MNLLQLLAEGDPDRERRNLWIRELRAHESQLLTWIACRDCWVRGLVRVEDTTRKPARRLRSWSVVDAAVCGQHYAGGWVQTEQVWAPASGIAVGRGEALSISIHSARGCDPSRLSLFFVPVVLGELEAFKQARRAPAGELE